MTIKDFKIESNLSIDNTIFDFDYSTISGGLRYDQSSQSLKSFDSNIPVGVVRMWANGSTSASAPSNYLICDGRQDLSKTEYSRLYSVIGDRFTNTPNENTFGIPSFNSSSKQYPLPVGINTSNDSANAGVFLQTANQNTIFIGGDASTSHSHSSGNSFSVVSTTSVSLSHTHNTGDGVDSHGHNWDAGTTGGTAHNHNSGNASAAHAHGYLSGNNALAESSGPTGGHTHAYGWEDSQHAHNVGAASHTHGTGGPSEQSSNTHSHNFTASLVANQLSHTHQVDTSGFYFIIRYQ